MLATLDELKFRHPRIPSDDREDTSYLAALDALMARHGDRPVCAEVYLAKAEYLYRGNRQQQPARALAVCEEAIRRYAKYERINEVRNRARQSTSVISDYPAKYHVTFNVRPYEGSFTQEEALKRLKFERRLELAMECDRFFDLVRWGDAKSALGEQGKEIPQLGYFAVTDENGEVVKDEAGNPVYEFEQRWPYTNTNYGFQENKHELLPIPLREMEVNSNMQQNPGW